jgi:tetratricopeptide (TPR) repeat protein
VLRDGVLGRDLETATVRHAVERALRRDGGLLLVSGEPGIGKTTLAGLATEDARRAGILVVSGTCWDGGGAPGYWPWIQVVRAIQRAVPAQWPGLLATAGDALAWLLGTSGSQRPAHFSDESAFQIADAVCRLVIGLAETRPTLILLEDLHWADTPSIRLLDFLVRQITLERVLVIGTYRNTEIQVELQQARSLLFDLESKSTCITLTGLDRVSVAALVGRSSGIQPDEAVVDEVFSQTAGNPFFVEQMARLYSTFGSLQTIPPSVKQAVQQRLARVPEETREVLSCAAVLGLDIQLEVLAAATQRPSHEVARLLEPAFAAGLVARPPVSHIRFVHDLVRETLNAHVDEPRRRQIHAAVVETVQTRPQVARSLLPAQIAHWACMAVPVIPAETAVEYILAAAAEAAGRHSSEEVCAHYRRALELLSENESARRWSLMLLLGTEEQRSGQLDAARRTFTDLIAAAREINDPDLFAGAALGLHTVGHSNDDQPMAIQLLDEACQRLEAAASLNRPLGARLLAAASQARTHHIGESRTYIEELSGRAVDLARATGDVEALGYCLLARHDAIWRAGTARERISLADEMTLVGRRSDDTELVLQASLLRMVAWLEQGDPRGLIEARAFAELAERHRLPRFRYTALSRQATVAMLQGRFDEARALMDTALAYGQQLGEAEAIGVWADQRWGLARARGTQSDLEDAAAALRASGAADEFVLEVAFALQSGDTTRVRPHLEQLQALADAWPRWAELAFIALRAELASASSDPPSYTSAREAILPVADQWAVLGGAVLVHGPMAYWLALVDFADGRWDEAIEEFALARRAADRLLARPWSVRAALGLAEARIARAAPGDLYEAARLLDSVEADAGALGVQDVVTRAGSARHRLTVGNNVLRCDGDVWTVSFAGRTVVLPDAKGLRDVHTLLVHSGQDVSVMALAGADGLHPAQSEPVLDTQAKLEYARRIQLIEAETDDALSVHDDARATALDREREQLIDELRRATGLGGRARRFSDDAERARKAVSARIRDTFRHLDSRHPELASHLRDCISTGTSCRYQPREAISWILR